MKQSTKSEPELSINDKILLAIYELDKKRKEGEKITKEEMVIKVWKMFPEDFCIKGYPQYPNADISKYVTKLFKDNLLKGSFYNYILTLKGKEYAERLLTFGPVVLKKGEIISSTRQIDSEVSRIKSSKIFQLFLKGEKEFIESDLFDFLGTSSRSFNDANKTPFISKYNFIVKEVIPFCEKIKSKDGYAKQIVILWGIFSEKFKETLNKKIKT